MCCCDYYDDDHDQHQNHHLFLRLRIQNPTASLYDTISLDYTCVRFVVMVHLLLSSFRTFQQLGWNENSFDRLSSIAW